MGAESIAENNWDLKYKFFYENQEGNIVLCSDNINIAYKPHGYDIAIKTPNNSGKYNLNIIVSSKNSNIYFHKIIPMIIIDE